MLRRPPRAWLGWCGAGLAALFTVHTVASDLAALHSRAREAGPEVPVVVVARDVALGERLGRADVRLVRRHARHLPPQALRAVAGVAGRVARSPLLAGSVVTERHLAARHRTGLDGVVPAGMRAVPVPVEGWPTPAPGSVVDVLVTFDPSLLPQGPEPTTVVAHGALVLSAAGVGGLPTREADNVSNGGGAGLGGTGVVLLVTEEEARRLAFAAASGVVTLALAPPEEARRPHAPHPAPDEPSGARRVP